jgi:hypothetical protein
MIVECSGCGKRYWIDPSRVKERAFNYKCKVCDKLNHVESQKISGSQQSVGNGEAFSPPAIQTNPVSRYYRNGFDQYEKIIYSNSFIAQSQSPFSQDHRQSYHNYAHDQHYPPACLMDIFLSTPQYPTPSRYRDVDAGNCFGAVQTDQ